MHHWPEVLLYLWNTEDTQTHTNLDTQISFIENQIANDKRNCLFKLQVTKNYADISWLSY